MDDPELISMRYSYVYKQWREKEITAVEAMRVVGMKKNTWYNRVKEYEADITLKK
ncbi:hypothetical protein [Propionispira raffinosivorans]|uniref:hypothetical protein n=1 Tax=Propionispira raffinosivorans TaxID=86959 RepID=UPI0012B597BD|nr:hypothetical protein [Propionispira raffinosivorans]